MNEAKESQLVFFVPSVDGCPVKIVGDIEKVMLDNGEMDFVGAKTEKITEREHDIIAKILQSKEVKIRIYDLPIEIIE